MTPTASAAAMTARTPSARNSGVAAAVAVAPADRRPDRSRRRPGGAGRPAQSSSSSQLRAIDGGAMDERPQALGVDAPGRDHGDPAPDDVPQAHREAPLGDVLVDLAVGEPGQRRVAGHDEDLGLGGADPQRPTEDVLGEREGRLGILGAGPARGIDGPSAAPARRTASAPGLRLVRAAHHLPTPTWTLRNRAPGTACPTRAVCDGSPLPQFGVPSITKLRSSPTASHERQNS